MQLAPHAWPTGACRLVVSVEGDRQTSAGLLQSTAKDLGRMTRSRWSNTSLASAGALEEATREWH